MTKKPKNERVEAPSSPMAGSSGIRDNYRRGTAADFLRAKIVPDSRLSIVSAFFTIYAFDALKDHLAHIEHLDFLFGEPRFINSLDPDRAAKKSFIIDPAGLQLANRLEQKRVARECADWIRDKVSIRSVIQSNLLHGKMYHVSHNGVENALLGSSNFTVRGLGLGAAGNNIELNLEVDSNRDRRDLKTWFDEIWNDQELVEDVKSEVLLYLAQLYQNNAPEFIYYKTLFHIFEDFLADQAKGGLLDQNIKIVDKHIGASGVKAWENVRGPDRHFCVWHDRINYLVVVKQTVNAFLLKTTYCPTPQRRLKLHTEYAEAKKKGRSF